MGACDGSAQASGVQDINSYMVLDKDCREIAVTTRPVGSPQRCLQVQWPATKVNRTGDVQILGCGDHPCLAVAGVGLGTEVVARASSMAPQLTVSTLAAVSMHSVAADSPYRHSRAGPASVGNLPGGMRMYSGRG